METGGCFQQEMFTGRRPLSRISMPLPKLNQDDGKMKSQVAINVSAKFILTAKYIYSDRERQATHGVSMMETTIKPTHQRWLRLD